MKFYETSKHYSLKKSTYISLRWIGIIGQIVSVYIVYFYFNFDFDFLYSNLVILIGILSNIYLIFVIQRDDCKKFAIANDIDIEYAELLTNAIKNKLNVYCYDCKFSSKGIKINREINFK